MADLQSLIQKLEKATEGSRELDGKIATQIGAARHYEGDGFYGSALPRYTTSLDAALRLVPEGMEWESTNLYGVARVGVGLNAHEGPFYGTHEGGSLPLALCIAALRARLASAAKEE